MTSRGFGNTDRKVTLDVYASTFNNSSKKTMSLSPRKERSQDYKLRLNRNIKVSIVRHASDPPKYFYKISLRNLQSERKTEVNVMLLDVPQNSQHSYQVRLYICGPSQA